MNPTLKGAAKEFEIRGSNLVEAIAVDVDRLVNARESVGGLDKAIETIVGTIGQLMGKDAKIYVEAYRAEMIMMDIPEDRRLSQFLQVVTPSIHAEVLKVQADCRNWMEFEGRLLENYGFEESLWFS